jgi:hypothetical protein
VLQTNLFISIYIDDIVQPVKSLMKDWCQPVWWVGIASTSRLVTPPIILPIDDIVGVGGIDGIGNLNIDGDDKDMTGAAC